MNYYGGGWWMLLFRFKKEITKRNAEGYIEERSRQGGA